jgi:phosphatidylethanolamine-binding protein (PEBP) family uncharacterized protein
MGRDDRGGADPRRCHPRLAKTTGRHPTPWPVVAAERGCGDSVILSRVADFALQSGVVDHGRPIPRRHSCEGEDLSPPLSWSGAPADTRSLALVVDDPDAPAGTFTHWLGWAHDPAAQALGEGEGRTGRGAQRLRHERLPRALLATRPRPPPLLLPPLPLHSDPCLRPDAGKRELERALEAHTLAEAELIGTCQR